MIFRKTGGGPGENHESHLLGLVAMDEVKFITLKLTAKASENGCKTEMR